MLDGSRISNMKRSWHETLMHYRSLPTKKSVDPSSHLFDRLRKWFHGLAEIKLSLPFGFLVVNERADCITSDNLLIGRRKNLKN